MSGDAVDLTELIADRQHVFWAQNVLSVLSKCDRRKNGDLVIPAQVVLELQERAKTAYSHLSEKEQAYARGQAEKIIEVLQ